MFNIHIIDPGNTCSTLYIACVSPFKSKGIVECLVSGINKAESKEKKDLTAYFQIGALRIVEMGPAVSNGMRFPQHDEVNPPQAKINTYASFPLSGYSLKAYAFIMFTDHFRTGELQTSFYKELGFVSSKQQYNSKNETTICLWYAHIPDFIKGVKNVCDEFKVQRPNKYAYWASSED